MMKTDVWCEDGQSNEETSKHELKRRCECEGLRSPHTQPTSTFLYVAYAPFKHFGFELGGKSFGCQ